MTVEESASHETDRFVEPSTSIPPIAVLRVASRTWPSVGSQTCRVYRPDDDFGVVAAAEDLAIRYEDEPERREDTDREIRTELDRYLNDVPFQV